MSFNSKIKELREKKSYTQQDLADRLYVSRQTICRWEKGTRCPDIFVAKKLAIELDTTLDDLISEEELTNIKKEKLESQSVALEGISAISQIFMIITFIKDNSVWRAFLAISLFGFSMVCFKRWSYRFEKPWIICGGICLLSAILLSIKFLIYM